MPITVPPFVQFQEPMFPLRGLWEKAPVEGPMFVNAAVSWVNYPGGALQFALSGNSPVALSQIVALYVDNRRCGVDIDFLFPDSGFLLTVPAHDQGLYPVLTNALMFYMIGSGSETIDTTVVQILNSLPPPIALASTVANNVAAVAATGIINATTVIIPATLSGKVNAMSLMIDITSNATITIRDGTPTTVWAGIITDVAGGAGVVPVNLSDMNARFRDGLFLVVTGAAGSIGFVTASIYYQTP
jgi:hypothetical protein